MSIGLNKRISDENLQVTEVAPGLFVVKNAYEWEYSFSDSGEELFQLINENLKETEKPMHVVDPSDAFTPKTYPSAENNCKVNSLIVCVDQQHAFMEWESRRRDDNVVSCSRTTLQIDYQDKEGPRTVRMISGIAPESSLNGLKFDSIECLERTKVAKWKQIESRVQPTKRKVNN